MTTKTAKVREPDLFRPTSISDFNNYAKALQWLIGGKLTTARDLLARMYGHASEHALKAAMKTFALSGPFEPDVWGPPHHEFGVARRANLLRFVERHVNVEAGISPARKDLVRELGLFDRPSTHRDKVHAVKEAVRLIETEGWAWRNAIRYAELYLCRMPETEGLAPLLVAPLLVAEEESFRAPWYSPSAMLHSLRQVRAASLYMEGRPVIAVDEAVAEYLAGYYAEFDATFVGVDSLSSFLPSLPEMLLFEVKGLAEFSFPKPSDDLEEDAFWEELELRKDAPWELTPRLAAYLVNYEKLEALLPHWTEVNLQALASSLMSRSPVALYWGVIEDEAAQALGFCGRVYISLSSVDDGEQEDEDRCLALWQYRAVFVSEGEDKRFHAEAVMRGVVLEPSFGWTCPSETAFLSEMDSSDFVDIWGVITQEVLPELGLKSIADFANERDQESFITVDEFACTRKITARTLAAMMKTLIQSFQEPIDWRHTCLDRGDEISEFYPEREPRSVTMTPTVILVASDIPNRERELDPSGLRKAIPMFRKINRKFEVELEYADNARPVDVFVYDNNYYDEVGSAAYEDYRWRLAAERNKG